jgi:hypothetical protein
LNDHVDSSGGQAFGILSAKRPLFIDLLLLLKTLQFSNIAMMMAQKLSSNIDENNVGVSADWSNRMGNSECLHGATRLDTVVHID